MKKSKKLNKGCLKIFQFIQLLYEDKAYYNSVIEIFKDDVNEQSANNIQVILNKYINTLKIFGIKIVKEKNKYKLLSSLYSMNFTMDDLKAISIILSSIQKFPNEELSNEINKFIQTIYLRMNNDDKNTLNNIIQNIHYDFSFYYSNLREQIEQCKQICKEKFIINVIYLKNEKEIRCKCTPVEVIYDSKTVYLKVYESQSRSNIEIPLSNILSISKLPQVASSMQMTQTVVFKLKNRLAKTYKPKTNEYIQGYEDDGSIIVINKDEPFDTLIQRLMRYSFNCEIISPKILKQQMIDTINKTLNNYEE